MTKNLCEMRHMDLKKALVRALWPMGRIEQLGEGFGARRRPEGAAERLQLQSLASGRRHREALAQR